MSGTEGRFNHGRHGSPRSRDTERRRGNVLRGFGRTNCCDRDDGSWEGETSSWVSECEDGVRRNVVFSPHSVSGASRFLCLPWLVGWTRGAGLNHGRHGSPRSRDTEERREGVLRDFLRVSCRDGDDGLGEGETCSWISGCEGGVGRDVFFSPHSVSGASRFLCLPWLVGWMRGAGLSHGRHGSPRSRDTERRREGELRVFLRASCCVDHGVWGNEGGIGRDVFFMPHSVSGASRFLCLPWLVGWTRGAGLNHGRHGSPRSRDTERRREGKLRVSLRVNSPCCND